MTEKGRTDVREISLEALLLILEEGTLSHLVIAKALKKYQYLDKRERAFFTRLTEGTLERVITLDYVLSACASIPARKMKPVIRMILRMGAYQLLYMDSVPDSAACNEAVRLARKKGFRNLTGFVNGVLRTIAREKEKLLEKLCDPSQTDLSVRYSTPEWMVEEWKKAYGVEITEKLLKASLEERKTTVRCCLDKASREEIVELLKKEQVEGKLCVWPSYALELSGYDYLEGLPSFQEGYFVVQDISSMMVAEAAGIRQGFQIIDVCAAPGGKSLHVAEKLRGTGYVEARDLTEYKIGLLEENIARTGLSNIRACLWDAAKYDSTWEQRADVVLADLPCSGLGVIGKKNDLKYRITNKDLEELAALQRELLTTVSRYVKPGGCLIYSTCTINPGENQENVAWMLSHLPFEMESLLDYLPEELINSLTTEQRKDAKEGSLTFLPGINPCDGFFLARLRRR